MNVWSNDELVSNVYAGHIGISGFNPCKIAGITTNLSYGLHYTASADL